MDKLLRSTLETADKMEAHRTSLLQAEVVQSAQSASSYKHPQMYGLKRGVYDSIHVSLSIVTISLFDYILCIARLLPPMKEDIGNTLSFLELLVDQLRDLNVSNNAKLRSTLVLVGILRLESNSDRRQALQNYLTNLDLPVVAISMLLFIILCYEYANSNYSLAWVH